MRRAVLTLAVFSLVVAGCAGEAATAPDFVASGLARVASTASGDDVAAVSAAEARFAADLYEVLAAGDGNLVFSPASIHLALAMTLAGARGDTATQMEEALAVDGIASERLHAALNALDVALADRNVTLDPLPNGIERRIALSIANSLWGQADFEFEQQFLDLLATEYGAGMHVVDFVAAAEEARVAINAWVADQTGGLITDLIPEGAISSMTRLVIVNAIHLEATWAETFDPEATADGDFVLLDGSTVSVPTMHATLEARYAEGAGWQAVDLPYVGGDLSMLLIVPDEGAFADVEGLLATGLVDDVRSALEARTVRVSLPTFEVRTQTGLVPALRALGMTDAFDPGLADLGGISSSGPLYVSDVVHEAFIAVDEQGTEAAAATAVIIDLTSAPLDPAEIDVDRPFLFLLQDRPTGAVLFMGRVVDPR